MTQIQPHEQKQWTAVSDNLQTDTPKCSRFTIKLLSTWVTLLGKNHVSSCRKLFI